MLNRFKIKNDYKNAVIDIVDFLSPYCSEENIKNTGDNKDLTAREIFSKMLWAISPFINCENSNRDIEDLYRMGIINGTNPNGKGYWGISSDFNNEFDVMAPVVCGLLMNSDIILYLFTKNERQDIVNWLYNINFYKGNVDEKQFLVILVNSALKLFGRNYDKIMLNRAFDTIENMYIGGGWYGIKGKADYMATLSIQFYSLIYAKTMADYDEKRCIVYTKRAEELIRELYDKKLLLKNKKNIAILGFCSACFYRGINTNDINIINIMKNAMEYYSNLIIKTFAKISKSSVDSIINAKNGDFITWYMKTFLVLTLPQEHKFWTAC